jgi:hypothetical protein
MKQTIIIHGMPEKEEYYRNDISSPSNAHWFPWLQKELAVRDELSQVLEMPKLYFPIYADYVEVFEQNSVIMEMKKVHPYEEVAYDVYPLLNI